MALNAITRMTRSWIMGQGHTVAAIDSTNLLLDNMTPAHAERYSLTDAGLTRYVRDFYSYRLTPEGIQDSPLGSQVNPHTAGGLVEGGYLGFTELQDAISRLKNHAASGRPKERDHALSIATVQANPHLRPRVGNPDEMRSNRLLRSLDALKFRVTDPEPDIPEDIYGAVITVLNEKAVAAAALANKGGINLVTPRGLLARRCRASCVRRLSGQSTATRSAESRAGSPSPWY
jgi:phosphoketolase